MTTDAVEPWVAVGPPPNAAGFFDEPSFLDPGPLATWRREQAQLAAEEAREAAERQDRADARRAVAEWNARQSALSRGLPWSPERPFEHEPSIYEKADSVFAYQDMMARQADFAAAREAGLLHLLHQHQGVPSTPEEPVRLEPPEPSGSAARGVPLIGPPDTSTPAGRARAALRRWAADKRHRNRMEQR